jgi:hypothetical protein
MQTADPPAPAVATAPPADPIAAASVQSAVRALSQQAVRLRQRAQEGLSVPEGHSPAVSVLSPEAAAALRWAACYEAIAADLETRPPT